MLVIEIAGDDLVKNGEFVILGRVPLAIAQANGAENMLDAERKLFSRINAGVQQGTLNPLHPENLTPLPKGTVSGLSLLMSWLNGGMLRSCSNSGDR